MGGFSSIRGGGKIFVSSAITFVLFREKEKEAYFL